jgi:peptidoglycan glycosyltransferase
LYSPVPGSGNPIHNDDAETCPQATITLINALTVSCNTAFAQLGVSLGADAIKQEAQNFGFGTSLTLPNAGSGDPGIKIAASETGSMEGSDGQPDPNFVAQSSIGQYDVRMTPMQGALMAETVADNGVQRPPYIVQKVQDSDLKTTYDAGTNGVGKVLTPITPAVAAQLQTMMRSVVLNGTATNAQITGYFVAGKTGTAENVAGALNHRWFIGFASLNGKPIAAVAVLLVNAGNLGHKGAPTIAGDILRAAIAAKGH